MHTGSTTPLGAGGMSRVFGVLAQPHDLNSKGGVFGSYTTYLRDLVERAQAEGWVAYVFSYRDLLRQRRLIWGWTRTDGGWERVFCVLPHVAIVRRTSLIEAEMDALNWLREDGGVHFFNHAEVDAMTNDRWRLLQILSSSPTLTRNVPNATLLRDSSTLAKLSAEQESIIAYDRFRNHPNEVVLLKRQESSMVCSHEFGTVQRVEMFRSLLRVRSYLETRFKEPILQPFITPLRLEGHPVLIRVFAQRGAQGPWGTPQILVRVGQKEMVGGHYATAGTIDRVEPLLIEQLGKRAKAFAYNITSIVDAIVRLLDVRAHGLAELTVDLQPSEDSELFVHDVTVSAGVLSLQRLGNPKARAASIQTTIAHAQHLHTEMYAPTRLNASSVRMH